MKTTAPHHRPLEVLACLFFAMAAVSCRTTSPPPKEAAARPAPQVHWVKVSSHPPTYYPKGVAADCPTDHWSGEWVYTGDEKGVRYFIPFGKPNGMDRKSLVDDALAARTNEKLEQIALEDKEIQVRNVRNMALFGPPIYSGLLLVGMAGAWTGVGADNALDLIDPPQLQKEWRTSKEPH